MHEFRVATWLCLALAATFDPLANAAQPVQERLGSNPKALYLVTGTVDLTNAPSLLDDPNAGFDPGSHYVIQLDGPITADRHEAIAASGITLGEYLPMYAYIVKGADLNRDALRNLSFVRWVGLYESDWKTAPSALTVKTFETDERKQLALAGKKRMVIHLFGGADFARAARKVADASGKITDLQPIEENCRMEVEIDSAAAANLAAIAEVQFVDEALEGVPRNSTTTWIAQSNVSNFTPLWDAGLHGENQVVGLIDWGLDENHCAFNDSVPPGPDHRKLLAYFVADGQTIPGGFGYHGTYTGCILAGLDLSATNPDFTGMAYNSKLVMQHYTGNITTANLFSRLQYAHDLGASVHSNSWGSSSVVAYSAWCVDIDTFSRTYEDDLILVAIMNGSAGSLPGSIRSPENAKNCLATAATLDTPNQEGIGSGARGPTTDGRQKPEIWIPGCPNSAAVLTPCGVSTQACATSWSAPAASGMVTLARQYFMEGFYPSGAANMADAFTPSGALLKAVMVNSARNMTSIAGYFGTHEGYGRVLMDDALFFNGEARKLAVHDVRNADGLSTSDTDTYHINVLSSAERLKISLVWTDVPASLNAALAPVNNLNLVVTDPSNNVYNGNAFDSNAESIVSDTTDSLNNSEQVLRSNPETGVWRIDINAAAVNSGLQGYALVISGNMEPVVVCLKGDLNDDGTVNAADISGFVSVLLNGGTPREFCAADVNGINGAGPDDVNPFVSLLLGVTFCPRVKGDLNGDMLVDGADVQGFTTVLITGGTPDELCAADFDYSDVADLTDLNLFMERLIEPGT